ncbi:DapH/DapD/GlmU-related protein [Leisingera sp. F5]|uniref:acyltransferase n=1 Tax=Leisingera sp. F5 TaxID=1813816 RepID=UPI000B29C556|nr:acyltransferase [Leisingera sp. F5]
MGRHIHGNRQSQASDSALNKYLKRVVGSRRKTDLLKYELITMLLTNFPGAAGLILRQKIYPLLVGHYGKGTAVSRGVTLRCPNRLSLGAGSMIDDGVFFDIKSDAAAVTLGARSQIMHGAHFETGYSGHITLGDDCYVGAFAILNGYGGLEIGNNALIAGHCHIVSGNHCFADLSQPMNSQGIAGQGIIIEDDVWLGAGVKVLDGIRIGRGSIVSAGAVVTRDVPPCSIMGGVPAKLIRQRRQERG